MSKFLASFTVFFGMFLAAMESLVGSTVLPSVISSLGGIDLYPWMVSSFLLAIVVTTPLFGKLVDQWGFARVYFIATIFFAIGSLHCGLARTMPELIFARGIQGIGSAGLITLCIIYAGIAYPLRIRHKMQALISAMWAIASLFGPAFGALMVAYFSWRYAFLANVPCAILIAILTVFYLRHLPYPKVHTRFDFWGAAVFTVAALMLLFSLIQIGQLQFTALEFVLMVVAIILFIYLIKRGERRKGAFMSMKVLRERPVVGYSLGIGFLTGAFLFTSANFLPLFVQGVQGLSVGNVGQVVMGMVMGTCLGSLLTAVTLNHLGFRNNSLLGSAILTIGVILLAVIHRDSSIHFITLAIFLTGFGLGVSANGAIVTTQSYSDREDIGTTTSFFSFFRGMGGMLFISLLGSLQLAIFRNGIAENSVALNQSDAMEVFNHYMYILEPFARPQLPLMVMETLSQSLGYSLHIALTALVPFTIAHFWLSSKMPKIKPHEIELPPSIEAMGE